MCVCQHPVGRTFCSTRLESSTSCLADWVLYTHARTRTRAHAHTHTRTPSLPPSPLSPLSPSLGSIQAGPLFSLVLLESRRMVRRSSSGWSSTTQATHTHKLTEGESEGGCWGILLNAWQHSYRTHYSSELTKDTSEHRDIRSCSLAFFIHQHFHCVPASSQPPVSWTNAFSCAVALWVYIIHKTKMEYQRYQFSFLRLS